MQPGSRGADLGFQPSPLTAELTALTTMLNTPPEFMGTVLISLTVHLILSEASFSKAGQVCSGPGPDLLTQVCGIRPGEPPISPTGIRARLVQSVWIPGCGSGLAVCADDEALEQVKTRAVLPETGPAHRAHPAPPPQGMTSAVTTPGISSRTRGGQCWDHPAS